ncbi:MAG: hypothetical protein ACO1NX_05205 [Chitinophagaceae bacterium]
MNNTVNTRSAFENHDNEVSYLMGTLAIVLMMLMFVGAGFYLLVSNYA